MTDWLRYSNQGATRNHPLNGELTKAMSSLPGIGVSMEVFSGGQPAKGTSVRRTGSTCHDHGHAADVFFYQNGWKLDWTPKQTARDNEAAQGDHMEAPRGRRAGGVHGAVHWLDLGRSHLAEIQLTRRGRPSWLPPVFFGG